jgi:hypothetical protein
MDALGEGGRRAHDVVRVLIFMARTCTLEAVGDIVAPC